MTTPTGSFWDFGVSLPLLAAVALATGLAVATAVTAVRRSPHRRGVTLSLEIFRLALILLLLFTLCRPEWVRRSAATARRTLVVLEDRTDSMATVDVATESDMPHQSRARWTADFVRNMDWSLPGSGLQVVLRPMEASASGGTDLHGALLDVLREHADLRAVLLLSDGDWTAGQDPLGAAARYRLRDVPIHTLAIGDEAYLPDLVLEDVRAPAYALAEERLLVPFTVRNRFAKAVQVPVRLTASDGSDASRVVRVEPGGMASGTLALAPMAEGVTTLELRIPVLPGEVDPSNNVARAQVLVRREILRVLLIEGAPRWEYRYLRNALQRDPGVEVGTLLLHPNLPTASGPGYLDAFPPTLEALSAYDVIFLGDVGIGPRGLRTEEAARLAGVVAEHACGLVFLPGILGEQARLVGSPLADLLPVTLDPSQPTGSAGPIESNLDLTVEGRRHLLSLFDADPERNAAIWQRLPGFWWHAPVVKSRPGSATLAVHASARNEWGRLPLLVVRDHGLGKVLYLGTDGAWRWRRSVEDRHHYRFWAQVVRWMAHARHRAANQRLRLLLTPEAPRPGDRLQLHALALQPDGSPLRQPALTVRLETPSGRAEEIVLAQADAEWGTYRGSAVLPEPGTYRLDVRERDLPALSRELEVAPVRVEAIGRPARPDTLASLSELTGGRSSPAPATAELLNALHAAPETLVVEQRVRLWSHPAWGGAILGLLAAYWIGRKLAGTI
jgi:hypothetical protein